MPKVVQQRRNQQHFRTVMVDDFAEARVATKLPDIANGVVKDAEGVFESCVVGSGINLSSQTELRNVPKPLKFCRVNDRANSRRKRNILLVRNSDDASAGVETGDFRNVAERVVHKRHPAVDCSSEFWPFRKCNASECLSVI